jgi:hypothetical protein
MDEKRYPTNSESTDTRYLTENGREVLGWRVVDGERKLVVVEIGFVIVAQPSEDFDVFRARMLRFASRLATMRYPVLHLTFHRREAQRKLPWAEFECATPEAALPEA